MDPVFWSDFVRGLAVGSAAALAVSMAALARAYARRKDVRWALAVGYACAMAYVVVEQVNLWAQEPTWRTWLALASSAVGWWAVARITVHGRRRRR